MLCQRTRVRWQQLTRFALLLAPACCLTAERFCWGQVAYERPPIDYLDAASNNPVARLQGQIDLGQVRLTFDGASGYLSSLLKALDISSASQMLVFSRTSFQQSRITPRHPRAVYFNDNTYVGWVQRGDVLEISAVDASQGAVFYTLDQRETDRPQFERQTYNCLTCHASSNTSGVPGHFVRSVYTARSGRPVLSAGTFRTDYTSPLVERWGGWYVTGTHGSQRHMGNVTFRGVSESEALDVEAGANVTDLADLLDTTPYLTPHSDIVALMVLEHQVVMHNAITAANYSARITQRDARIMNEALGRDVQYESDSTRRRYDSAAEKVLDVLLLVDEHRITDRVTGSSDFAREFQQRGPFDRQGRSLRALDLETRLFKYPCSYLIYSDAFDALPSAVRDRVLRRLGKILGGDDMSDEYRHLSQIDRQAIMEILTDTKSNLPHDWKAMP